MKPDQSPRSNGPDAKQSGIVLAEAADFTLGELTVRPSLREIVSRDWRETIEPRVMEVLVVLATARGGVISREHLIETCWGGRLVSDDAIERCIGKLRRLGQRSGAAGLGIETIPRVGYRLTHAVPAVSVFNGTRWLLAGAVALSLAALAALLGSQSTPQGAWTILESKPAIATPLVERWPAISPDGKEIAYSTGSDIFTRKIYVKPVWGGSPVRLTSDAYDDTSPSWAPDGSRLAYVAFKAGEPCHLMSVPAHGGFAREVGRCRFMDRTSVIFGPANQDVYFLDKSEQDGPKQIMHLDLETGARIAITHPRRELSGDSNFVLSPNGSLIGFTRYSDRGYTIMVSDIQGGHERPLWQDNSWSDGLAWSEDSKYLFVATNKGGDHAIWLVPVTGEAVRRLTSATAYLGRLASGRGGLLAAEVSTNIQGLVETAGNSQAPPAPLYPAHGQTWSPAYAPDGALAFLSNRSGDNAVWLAADGNPRELARFGSNFIYHLRWSPDGGKLAFEKRDALRQLSVYIIDRTGRKITELSAPGDQLDAPTWKDDRTVLVAAQDRQGWRIWGSGLGRDSVFSPATGYGWRRAQFHDRALYATRTGEVGIWRLSDGKAPTLVLAPPAGETPWTFDGPNIVDVEPVNAAHPRFVRRSLDGTEGVVLGDANGYYADMTGEYGGGFAINPRSGGFAYVSVGNADTDIIMMRLQKGPAAAP